MLHTAVFVGNMLKLNQKKLLQLEFSYYVFVTVPIYLFNTNLEVEFYFITETTNVKISRKNKRFQIKFPRYRIHCLGS